MNATDDKTREGHDVLPLRAGKRGALKWIPHASDFAHGAGFVVLTMDRDTTSYSVTEFPTGRDDRGFMLTKVSGRGTDKKMSGYAVFCGANPERDACECSGHRRHGSCKHADAARTLLLNGWL